MGCVADRLRPILGLGAVAIRPIDVPEETLEPVEELEVADCLEIGLRSDRRSLLS